MKNNNMTNWEKDVELANMVIDEIGKPAIERFYECMNYYNKWASLMDVWFKVERQIGERTDEGIKKANEVCEAIKVVVAELTGDEFWNVEG